MAQFNSQEKVIERTSAIHHSNGEDITSSNGLPVHLSGRNIELIHLEPATAIRDINPKFSNVLDLKKYRNVLVVANSTLDQNVSIYIRFKDSAYGSKFWDGTTWKTDAELSLIISSGDSSRHILNTRNPALDKPGIISLSSRSQCTVAPTSGSLNIEVWGVPN